MRFRTDVGDEASVAALRAAAEAAFGAVDAVINNATIFPMGAVVDRQVGDWDRSYRVNLRGPVLLAIAFLPGMLKRGRGIFVCVSSSGAAPFMGAYEVFKTAQGELATTIAGEVEALKKLEAYWIHQQELLRGYGKNTEKLSENMKLMDGWVADIRELLRLLS